MKDHQTTNFFLISLFFSYVQNFLFLIDPVKYDGRNDDPKKKKKTKDVLMFPGLPQGTKPATTVMHYPLSNHSRR